MNYQLSWNLCNTFIYMFIGLLCNHVVYLQKKKKKKIQKQVRTTLWQPSQPVQPSRMKDQRLQWNGTLLLAWS